MTLIFCPVCNGSGNENKPGYKPVKCSLCNGTGTIDSETMDSLTENIPMEVSKMRSLSEISYEIEHDIIALTKMLFELRDKHGDKLIPWMESLREQELQDYEIVMQLVHAHGGME